MGIDVYINRADGTHCAELPDYRGDTNRDIWKEILADTDFHCYKTYPIDVVVDALHKYVKVTYFDGLTFEEFLNHEPDQWIRALKIAQQYRGTDCIVRFE